MIWTPICEMLRMRPEQGKLQMHCLNVPKKRIAAPKIRPMIEHTLAQLKAVSEISEVISTQPPVFVHSPKSDVTEYLKRPRVPIRVLSISHVVTRRMFITTATCSRSIDKVRWVHDMIHGKYGREANENLRAAAIAPKTMSSDNFPIRPGMMSMVSI